MVPYRARARAAERVLHRLSQKSGRPVRAVLAVDVLDDRVLNLAFGEIDDERGAATERMRLGRLSIVSWRD